QHGAVSVGLFLDADEVQFSIASDQTTMLKKMLNFKAEASVFCAITQVAVGVGGSVSGASVIFYGEVVKPSIRGKLIKVRLSPGGTKFDRGIPRPTVQQHCNNSLFDSGRTLVRTDWQFSPKINTPGPARYPVPSILDPIAGVATSANG